MESTHDVATQVVPGQQQAIHDLPSSQRGRGRGRGGGRPSKPLRRSARNSTRSLPADSTDDSLSPLPDLDTAHSIATVGDSALNSSQSNGDLAEDEIATQPVAASRTASRDQQQQQQQQQQQGPRRVQFTPNVPRQIMYSDDGKQVTEIDINGKEHPPGELSDPPSSPMKALGKSPAKGILKSTTTSGTPSAGSLSIATSLSSSATALAAPVMARLATMPLSTSTFTASSSLSSLSSSSTGATGRIDVHDITEVNTRRNAATSHSNGIEAASEPLTVEQFLASTVRVVPSDPDERAEYYSTAYSRVLNLTDGPSASIAESEPVALTILCNACSQDIVDLVSSEDKGITIKSEHADSNSYGQSPQPTPSAVKLATRFRHLALQLARAVFSNNHLIPLLSLASIERVLHFLRESLLPAFLSAHSTNSVVHAYSIGQIAASTSATASLFGDDSLKRLARSNDLTDLVNALAKRAEQNYPTAAKLFGALTVIFGSTLYRTPLLNKLLKVIEPVFNSRSQISRSYAFFEWRALISGFARSTNTNALTMSSSQASRSTVGTVQTTGSTGGLGSHGGNSEELFANEKRVTLLMNPISKFFPEHLDIEQQMECLRTWSALLYAMGPTRLAEMLPKVLTPVLSVALKKWRLNESGPRSNSPAANQTQELQQRQSALRALEEMAAFGRQILFRLVATDSRRSRGSGVSLTADMVEFHRIITGVPLSSLPNVSKEDGDSDDTEATLPFVSPLSAGNAAFASDVLSGARFMDLSQYSTLPPEPVYLIAPLSPVFIRSNFGTFAGLWLDALRGVMCPAEDSHSIDFDGSTALLKLGVKLVEIALDTLGKLILIRQNFQVNYWATLLENICREATSHKADAVRSCLFVDLAPLVTELGLPFQYSVHGNNSQLTIGDKVRLVCPPLTALFGELLYLLCMVPAASIDIISKDLFTKWIPSDSYSESTAIQPLSSSACCGLDVTLDGTGNSHLCHLCSTVDKSIASAAAIIPAPAFLIDAGPIDPASLAYSPYIMDNILPRLLHFLARCLDYNADGIHSCTRRLFENSRSQSLSASLDIFFKATKWLRVTIAHSFDYRLAVCTSAEQVNDVIRAALAIVPPIHNQYWSSRSLSTMQHMGGEESQLRAILLDITATCLAPFDVIWRLTDPSSGREPVDAARFEPIHDQLRLIESALAENADSLSVMMEALRYKMHVVGVGRLLRNMPVSTTAGDDDTVAVETEEVMQVDVEVTPNQIPTSSSASMQQQQQQLQQHQQAMSQDNSPDASPAATPEHAVQNGKLRRKKRNSVSPPLSNQLPPTAQPSVATDTATDAATDTASSAPAPISPTPPTPAVVVTSSAAIVAATATAVDSNDAAISVEAASPALSSRPKRKRSRQSQPEAVDEAQEAVNTATDHVHIAEPSPIISPIPRHFDTAAQPTSHTTASTVPNASTVPPPSSISENATAGAGAAAVAATTASVEEPSPEQAAKRKRRNRKKKRRTGSLEGAVDTNNTPNRTADGAQHQRASNESSSSSSSGVASTASVSRPGNTAEAGRVSEDMDIIGDEADQNQLIGNIITNSISSQRGTTAESMSVNMTKRSTKELLAIQKRLGFLMSAVADELHHRLSAIDTDDGELA
ncbi:hypothetical protein GQ42DRAFT_178319 [Ramicandelaber brevisporus]|nr:hypothetical protein GQ42DRAFT_178319 [Ramicandelaber brevisporus]